jgi:hypothetical protein
MGYGYCLIVTGFLFLGETILEMDGGEGHKAL